MPKQAAMYRDNTSSSGKRLRMAGFGVVILSRTRSHKLGVMVETIALADVSKPLTSLHTVRNLWLTGILRFEHDCKWLIEFGHA